MRVSRIRVRITSDRFPPNPRIAASTICKHRRACAAASPFATVFPPESSGAVPVTAMICPLRTAREIPTLGSKGEPVETRRGDGRSISHSLVVRHIIAHGQNASLDRRLCHPTTCLLPFTMYILAWPWADGRRLTADGSQLLNHASSRHLSTSHDSLLS
jgi:hypothetical protein